MSQTEVQLIKNGAVVDADINGMSSSKLSGALPAISGASLTNLPTPTGKTRNLIINGAMQVAQRGTSFTGITATGTFPVDRFLFHVGSLGTWTLTQSTDVPTGQGFANSIKCDVTTANTSPSGTAYARIDQRLEGQDLQAFCKGTSNAKQFAVSFWVKSPKTGTHILELQDGDNTRNISKAYTVSSADTWEKKELIIDADTTGAFGNDNGKSLTVAWWLSAGADYKSGTLATSWVSPSNANRVVGQVNVADSTSNDFYLCGVQLEVGSVATDFEHRSFAVEKRLCMRYFQKYVNIGATGFVPDNGSRSYAHVFHFPVEFRATPTLTLTNTGSTSGQYIGDGDNTVTISSLNAAAHTTQIGEMYFNLSSDLTNFRGAYPSSSDSSSRQTTFFFTAEL